MLRSSSTTRTRRSSCSGAVERRASGMIPPEAESFLRTDAWPHLPCGFTGYSVGRAKDRHPRTRRVHMRLVVRALLATAAVSLFAPSMASAQGFSFGVAAGEVTRLGEALGTLRSPGLGHPQRRHRQRLQPRRPAPPGLRQPAQRPHRAADRRGPEVQHPLLVPLQELFGTATSAVGTFVTAPGPTTT